MRYVAGLVALALALPAIAQGKIDLAAAASGTVFRDTSGSDWTD